MLFSILFSRLSLLLFRFRLSVARLVLESVWLHNDRTFFLARIDWKLLFWYLLPPLLLLLLSNCTKSRHTQKNNNKRRRPNMSTNMSSHFLPTRVCVFWERGVGHDKCSRRRSLTFVNKRRVAFLWRMSFDCLTAKLSISICCGNYSVLGNVAIALETPSLRSLEAML